VTISRHQPEVLVRVLGQPGDLGWVVMAHGEQYASEFGWNFEFEALVAQIVADYAAKHDPSREQAWIAELDGRRVGCVFCVRKDSATAQLRILLVTDDGRGHGLGRRLVQQCVDFARGAGYQEMVLGPTTLLPLHVIFIWKLDSSSPTKNRTTVSAWTWSVRTTNWT
jgi:GNAT superfamily N-acetyltransferase